MPSDDRDTDESEDMDKSGIVRTILSDLFETIADMDEQNQRRRSGTGSARSSNSRFDYGFSVGIGPPSEHIDATDADETPSALADTDHAATVHETEEGVVVTLDLPEVEPSELSAGVNSSTQTLLVGLDNEIIERVPLPHGNLEVGDASFNNGVLDVRLHGGDE